MVGSPMSAIAAWLEALGLAQYAATFEKNAIDMEILPELTDSDLEKLNVVLGHRKRMLKAIAGLQIVSSELPAASSAPRASARPVAPTVGCSPTSAACWWSPGC